MLNDLLLIERALTANGIDLVGRHPDIKDMAKGWALRVRLAEHGRASSVEVIAEAGKGAVWTLRDGQHNGFPGLKTAAGLLALDAPAREEHDRFWHSNKSPVQRRTELLRLLSEYSVDVAQTENWPSSGHRERVARRLRSLRTLADDPLSASVPAVFERFLAALDASPPFLEQLAIALAERVRNNGDDWIDPVRTALIAPIVLAIDVEDMEFQRDAGDVRQVGAIGRALSNPPSTGNEQVKGEDICALIGKSAKLHAGNFPQPNLPGLGQSYIYSCNKDIPSLARYGRTADASFQADAELVRRLAGAIVWLTHEDRRGKTWRLIPAESGDKPDLLVVSFPAPIPADGVDALVEDEAGDPKHVVEGKSRLEEIASQVLEQSRGIDRHGYAADMAVLVLRVVDPANRKAIYTRPLGSQEFFDAATRWAKAASNAPPGICHRVWIRKKDGTARLVLSGPLRVSPLSIIPLSRMQFVGDGSRRVPVRGVAFTEAFAFFLREGDFAGCARRMLTLLLSRHTVLLSTLTQMGRRGHDAQGQWYIDVFDPKHDLRGDALRSVSWIGVILHIMERPAEVYMNDVGFKLGQLLAAVDIVHIGYCVDEREGQIPMTLVGNSVFAIAGSDPCRAFAILQERWKPYGAWAVERPELTHKIERFFASAKPIRDEAKKLKDIDKDAEREKRREAARIEAPAWAMRNALAQMDRITTLTGQLAGVIGHVAVTDAFKAELLFGYMAGLPAAAD